MKVCEYCVTTVLESKLSWDYHNHSYDVLMPLPKDRCVSCAQLREDANLVAPPLSEADYTASWPTYRWSIRSLAQVREGLETVVVTFRYVSAEEIPNRDTRSTSVSSSIYRQESSIYFQTKARRSLGLITIAHADMEADLQPLQAIEQLGKKTNLRNNGTLLRKLVQRCDSTHTECVRRKRATPKALWSIPTRLLDTSGPPGSPIKVTETAMTTTQGPYCSLSHCWGLLLFAESALRDYHKEQFMTEGVAWNFLTTCS